MTRLSFVATFAIALLPISGAPTEAWAALAASPQAAPAHEHPGDQKMDTQKWFPS